MAVVWHERLWLVSSPSPTSIRDLGAVEDSAMGRPLKPFAEHLRFSALSNYENGGFHAHAHAHAHAHFSA